MCIIAAPCCFWFWVTTEIKGLIMNNIANLARNFCNSDDYIYFHIAWFWFVFVCMVLFSFDMKCTFLRYILMSLCLVKKAYMPCTLSYVIYIWLINHNRINENMFFSNSLSL